MSTKPPADRFVDVQPRSATGSVRLDLKSTSRSGVARPRQLRGWRGVVRPISRWLQRFSPTTPTPIFIISYNRGDMLERVVRSYLTLSSPVEIIVHDNGSDDPATREVLLALARSGIRVINAPKVHNLDELNSVNDTVQSYFRRARQTRYVVTDCDVDMSIAAPDALAVYGELLDQFPEAECVGPMLRIRDIPPTFPLFNWVMNRHIDAFWHKVPWWADTAAGRIAVCPAPVDTTFALHREGQRFRRMKDGIRVYFPYEAQHLDWYLSDTAGQDVYDRTSSEGIAHWNNSAQRERHRNDALQYQGFLYVDTDDAGALATKWCELDRRLLAADWSTPPGVTPHRSRRE